jgi:hypothetical protein
MRRPSVAYLAALLFLTAPFTRVAALTERPALSPAEEWIVERVNAGLQADLVRDLNPDQTKKFPGETERKLRARFFQDLLMGAVPGVKFHRHGILIRGAIFDEPLDFNNGRIQCQLLLAECRFRQIVFFQHARFDASAAFDDNTFEGEVNFNGAKVEGNIFFRHSVFAGGVNYVRADFAGDFGADGAKFQSKQKAAYFSSMKVRGGASFKTVVFEGPVFFRYADFALLDLSGVSWPKAGIAFGMQGMTYQYVRAVPDNERKSHEALLKIVGQADYAADVYTNLEAFFSRQGYREDADKAFIAGKRRERKEHLQGLGWLGSWLLDWLAGYGRRPSQAGYFSAAFVLLGIMLFSPKRMEPRKPEDSDRIYNRFWYSLGLFLPVVSLQLDKVWQPKRTETLLRHYAHIHVLLGWILIPIVLAALSGLIK